jgi:lipopolysaccharide transport system ATP-binding protein
MTDAVITVENLSKSYLVGHQSAQRARYATLREAVGREVRNFARKAIDLVGGRQIVQGDEVEEFWALKDVSFEVKRDEVLGIMGRNGAGKSTLLKILSRITEPTHGRVTIRGRVASLLEVGTGFHPELTGRENIYLNGAILGMTRAEIRKKFDEIVSFAEVERFLDTPVKRYSSGMYVRLAFAVAAHLEPEILLVDEVLAVGDSQFQKKCLGKMGQVAQSGRTVLFVSHNMRSMQQLCSKSIVLMDGSVRMIGPTDRCIDVYLTPTDSNGGLVDLSGPTVTRRGSGVCRFVSFELTDLGGKRSSKYRFGEPFYVDIGIAAQREIGEAVFGFSFISRTGYEIMGTAAQDGGSRSIIRKGQNQFRCKVDPMILNPGIYYVRAAIFTPTEIFDHVDEVTEFEIEGAAVDATVAPKNHYVGDVYVRYEWTRYDSEQNDSELIGVTTERN